MRHFPTDCGSWTAGLFDDEVRWKPLREVQPGNEHTILSGNHRAEKREYDSLIRIEYTRGRIERSSEKGSEETR